MVLYDVCGVFAHAFVPMFCLCAMGVLWVGGGVSACVCVRACVCAYNLEVLSCRFVMRGCRFVMRG